MRLSFLNEEKQSYNIVSTHWEEPIVYSVNIKEKLFIPHKQINTISYKAIVNCTKDEEQSIFYYRIEKKGLKINNKKPQNVFDHINIRIASILNVLEFKMGYLGNIDQLLNFAEIQKKWIIERKKLIKEYQGDSIDKYIRLINKSMEEEVLFLKLKKDPFLINYFNPYITNIQDEARTITAWDFFLGNTIFFKIIKEKQTLENSLINMVHKGEDIMSFEQKKSIISALLKKKWLEDNNQDKKVEAAVENEVVYNQEIEKIQQVSTKHSLFVDSQKIKSSLITIKKE